MLLSRDVNIMAKDKLGKTALQYACNEQVCVLVRTVGQFVWCLKCRNMLHWSCSKLAARSPQ